MSDQWFTEVQAYADHEIAQAWEWLSPSRRKALEDALPRQDAAVEVPATPAGQAVELDPKYRIRPHLEYLSDRLAQAVTDVENGQDRWMRISTPPRTGKSHLVSVFTPAWILRKHSDWKIGLLSHSPDLAASWGRQIRHLVESHPELGIELSKDAGAAAAWETTDRGSVISKSIPGQSVTGYGFKVLLVDDPVKDFASAHSEKQREVLWEAWQSNIRSRLEPPSLTCFIGTRWHEDDILGRLASREYAGSPDDWEVIELPALAGEDDVIGRKQGEPLLSPIVDETPAQALKRWESIRVSVGSYNWSALYQQRPAPSEGAIFDTSLLRYWTSDPDRHETDNVRFLDPASLVGGTWLDSWDMAFKETTTSDWVVGQRWVRYGPDRFLIAQQRGRWGFTKSTDRVRRWRTGEDAPLNPCGHLVHKSVIEDKANGPAVIETVKKEFAGVVAWNPRTSKEARAWAVTPECESGNVWVPHPDDPGNSWVTEVLFPELRDFPNAAHDDQVDAWTMALLNLRTPQRGTISIPGGRQVTPSRVAAARTTRHRRIM